MLDSTESRNCHLDNLKYLLIFLVVFGHFIENFQDIWNSSYIRGAWQFIYLFHMPCFAFISGYFSKKKDIRIFEKVLEKQIIPLVLFQFLFEILNIIYAHKFTGATFALTPYWTLWYLLSLAFWKIFFQMLYKVKFILAISIVLALGVGTVSSLGYPLSISRTIVLFPFFLVGNLCKELSVVEKLKNRKMFPLYLSISVIILMVSFVYVWKIRLPDGMYLNSYCYESIGVSWKKGIFFRLVNLSLAFLCIMSLIILIPQKKLFISEIGRNSVIPYVIHGFILKIFYLHRFEFYKNLYFTFFGGIIFSFLVVYFWGKDRIAKSYNKIMLKICDTVIIKA